MDAKRSGTGTTCSDNAAAADNQSGDGSSGRAEQTSGGSCCSSGAESTRAKYGTRISTAEAASEICAVESVRWIHGHRIDNFKPVGHLYGVQVCARSGLDLGLAD